jgi:predicted DNA-binding ribbon-helix-helix protein
MTVLPASGNESLPLLMPKASKPAYLPCSASDPCGSTALVQGACDLSTALTTELSPDLEKASRGTDPDGMKGSAIVKRSVRIAGHATSVSLEAAFWQGLCDIAAARRMSVNALLATIDAGRAGNLSSAIRLFVLDTARSGELT